MMHQLIDKKNKDNYIFITFIHFKHNKWTKFIDNQNSYIFYQLSQINIKGLSETMTVQKFINEP